MQELQKEVQRQEMQKEQEEQEEQETPQVQGMFRKCLKIEWIIRMRLWK